MHFVFYARLTGSFTGQTIYQSNLGGTESAVVYLGRELVKLGHKVTIFTPCQTKEEGVYDGVAYYNVLNKKRLAEAKKTKPDVLTVLREPLPFYIPFQARLNLWWGPDDFSPIYQRPPLAKAIYTFGFKILSRWMLTKIDHFAMVSQWQADLAASLNGLPAKYFLVLPNGYNQDDFQKTPLRHDHRLIYTSAPERGLDILLDIFPRIKAAVPQAELHIFSGKNFWQRSPEDDAKTYGDLYRKAAQPGVVLRGAVPQAQLAEELLQSTLFTYPMHPAPKNDFFAETFCIAALEAQAAGLPVIATRNGALPEVIADQETGILIAGDPGTPEYQDRFVRTVIDLLKDPGRVKNMGLAAARRARAKYPWSKIALLWQETASRLA